MKQLGHSKIDVLKVDIEYGEYALFADLATTAWPEVGQILLEIHLDAAYDVDLLFDRIFDAGYRVFHKEANVQCGPLCFEYAFVRFRAAARPPPTRFCCCAQYHPSYVPAGAAELLCDS